MFAAALLVPNVASAHVIPLGKSPQARAAKQARHCYQGHTTVKQFRWYVSRVYKRDEISKRAAKRVRMMHICQDTYQQRVKVGGWHKKYVEARKARSRVYAPVAGLEGVLRAIRMCESGGNYATDTGNGFYGAYQFMWSTWASVGGFGNPAHASPAEQDMRAAILYRRAGSSPWPNCA